MISKVLPQSLGYFKNIPMVGTLNSLAISKCPTWLCAIKVDVSLAFPLINAVFSLSFSISYKFSHLLFSPPSMPQTHHHLNARELLCIIREVSYFTWDVKYSFGQWVIIDIIARKRIVGKVKYGFMTKVASKFLVSLRIIYYIWKLGQTCLSNNKVINIASKMLEKIVGKWIEVDHELIQ